MALTGEDVILLVCIIFLSRGPELEELRIGEEAIGFEAASVDEGAAEGAADGAADYWLTDRLKG